MEEKKIEVPKKKKKTSKNKSDRSTRSNRKQFKKYKRKISIRVFNCVTGVSGSRKVNISK